MSNTQNDDIDALLNQMNDQYNAPKQTSAKGASKWDSRFIRYEAGKTYTMRLLWFPSERSTPFIESYAHSAIKPENGYRDTIVCPTTAKAGFDKCPICKNNTVLWDNFSKKGIQTDGAIYQKYKRKFRGYALVYVISDPTTPENNGKVRILQYTVMNQETLEREIFGRFAQGKGKDRVVTIRDDRLGGDAFKIKGGYDMIVSAVQSGEFLQTNFTFARRPTDIDATAPELIAQMHELTFNDTVKHVTPDALDAFYHKYVLADMGNPSGDVDLASIQRHMANAQRPSHAPGPAPAPTPAPMVEAAPAAPARVRAEAPAPAPLPAPPAPGRAPAPAPHEIDLDDIDSIVASIKTQSSR